MWPNRSTARLCSELSVNTYKNNKRAEHIDAEDLSKTKTGVKNMEVQEKTIRDALKRLADEHYRRFLLVDVTADEYYAMSENDTKINLELLKEKSGKFTELFSQFAVSSLCHENDRERVLKFADLTNLKNAFAANSDEAIQIVYRRKFDVNDKVYTAVSMKIMPIKTESKNQLALLYIRSISDTIQAYKNSMLESTMTARSATGKRTVLTIDDNVLNQEILKDMLSDHYDVLQAGNGEDGLAMLQEHLTEIAVVLLDVNMPVMNGYDFLEIVKSDPLLSEIPIIVATGTNSTDEEKRCLALGANDYVIKPYDGSIILSRIANIIRLKESVATISVLQYDECTGLYTLQAFNHYARKAIDQNPDKDFSAIIFDVERFKLINEMHGEEKGNQVLQSVATVLRDFSSQTDVFGRFGAARFLLLKETLPKNDMDKWIENLFEAMREACGVKGVSFRAGVYDIPDHDISLSVMYDRAISAMNSVGFDFEIRHAYYDLDHEEYEKRLARLESDMREALEKDQFLVYYQPKHDVGTGQLIGAEALIRWMHPEYGFLPPNEFIPLFERNGFISYADGYVWRRSCRNLRGWIDEGIRVVPISVNVSRCDFDYPNYLDIVSRSVNHYHLRPELLHIEVTETLFADYRQSEIIRILKRCQEAGFRVELDDFGSGYSSLNALSELPLDVIKLDMSFIKNIEDEKKMRVLASCINLAKSLDLRTVCEGVEKEEQVKILQELGCDRIQGFFYSKPIPEAEFRQYLIDHSEGKSYQ